MVIFDDGLGGGREIPILGEEFAGVAVREAEGFGFGVEERDVAGDGEIGGGTKGLGKQSRVDELADIVEESAEIDALGIGERKLAGEMLADDGTPEGVLPEGAGIERPIVLWRHLHQEGGPKNIAEAASAERDDSAANRLDGGLAHEEGGIRHAEALGGDGLVMRNHFGDFFDFELIGRHIEGLKDGSQNRGNGRHGV